MHDQLRPIALDEVTRVLWMAFQQVLEGKDAIVFLAALVNGCRDLRLQTLLKVRLSTANCLVW